MSRRQRLGWGAAAGLLLTVPLAVIFYLGNQLARLPLAPFDLFDWLTRSLPGGVITAGIDALVGVLTALGISVSQTAKLAEQAMAVTIFVLLGTAAGAALFALLRQGHGKAIWPGALLGAVLGTLLILAGRSVGLTGQGLPVLQIGWVVLVFAGWGVMLNRVYGKLILPEETASAGADLTVEQQERRAFLVKLGGASAAVTVVGAGLGAVLSRTTEREATIPGPNAPVAPLNPTPVPVQLPPRPDAVQPVPGMRPEYTPVDQHYRIDINLLPVDINGATWSLPLEGRIDNPLTLTLDDFYGERWGDPQHLFITLSCISNQLGGDLIGTTRWTGVPVRRVLEEAGLKDDAQYITMASQDGYYETTPLDLIMNDERIMLTYLWDGKPLLPEHGYPLRIYIPNRYGMKQPKWLTKIVVANEYRPGYWVERGWDKEAVMHATSVVDTVAVDSVYEQDGQRMIPVGGFAHAGDRGISKVEVRVDQGDWTEAELRQPLSGLTWVFWRYDWPFASGDHAFEVRCYEGDGALQPTEPGSPHPDGATGIHGITQSI